MFLGSNICWVNSGTETARKEEAPRLVRGAKPTMKKWRRGKGTMLTANLRRSELSWPGKRSEVLTPDMTAETRWFRSPYEGWDSLRVRMQISYRAYNHQIRSSSITKWDRRRGSPRYRYRRSRQSAQPTDGRKEWRCRARQRYRRPWGREQRRM